MGSKLRRSLGDTGLGSLNSATNPQMFYIKGNLDLTGVISGYGVPIVGGKS
jgi:hypothetical protein